MANTENRGYPKPVNTNWVSDDVNLLKQAFDMIDDDVAALLSSLAGKAAAVHNHDIAAITGLQAALDGKAAADHAHALADLTDVSGINEAPDGYALVKVAGVWIPQSKASLMTGHSHPISDITNLQTALDAKLSVAALAAATPKGTLVAGDQVPGLDSEAGGTLKLFSMSAIAARMAAALASVFAAAAHNHDSSYAPISATVPTGTVLDFAGSSAPTGFLLCYGQEVSRTTYPALDTALGTTFGAYTNGSGGAGSTHLRLPDLRGRVAAGKDDMGGTTAGRLGVTLTGTRASTANGNITALSSTAGLSVGMKAFGSGIGAGAVITAITSATALTLSVNNSGTGTNDIRFGVVDGATLGDAGGSQVHKLVADQMPSHTHDVPYTVTSGGIGSGSRLSDTAISSGARSTNGNLVLAEGGGQNHPNMQPTIILNKIIKT